MSANERQVGGNHYRGLKRQHWDFVIEHQVRYLEGCATKYTIRNKGNRKEDLQKVAHFIDKILESFEAGVYPPPIMIVDHSKILSFAQDYELKATETALLKELLTWRHRGDLLLARSFAKALIDRLDNDALLSPLKIGTPEDGGHYARQVEEDEGMVDMGGMNGLA